MQLVCLARRGKRLTRPPGNLNPRRPLAGAISAAFFDGHVTPVGLEQLRTLYWHNNQVPMSQRSGAR